MKAWLYGIGLAMLPIAYVGLMLATHQPIEWPVPLLMMLIVVPIFIFGKRINRLERDVRTIVGSKPASPPNSRSNRGRGPAGPQAPRT